MRGRSQAAWHTAANELYGTVVRLMERRGRDVALNRPIVALVDAEEQGEGMKGRKLLAALRE